MQKLRVGVLRGGPSSEYDISLKTGSEILTHLPRTKYDVKDVFIDRQGTWHMRGMPMEPHRALSQLDIAFLALHGAYGEDGQIQRLLDAHAIPYTGTGSLGSAVAMNKHLAKSRLAPSNIRMPFGVVVAYEDVNDQSIVDLFRRLPQPSVIKPLASGSSVGVTIAFTFDDFRRGIGKAFVDADRILIEEYIRGREATCAVVEKFRDEELYALPEIEIIPNKENKFFDFQAKYEGASQEICPGNFDRSVKQEIGRLAKLVHKELGLRHYSRSDFIVTPRGVYFLEVNTLPALTQMSLTPKAIAAVGCKFPDFLDHLVTLAYRK